MPTRRQHNTTADRQRAYRARQQQARVVEQEAKGLPIAPSVPTMPSVARWNALLQSARVQVETAQTEMQEYFDERSEQWQEGEKGEAMQTRIEALEAVLEALAEAEG